MPKTADKSTTARRANSRRGTSSTAQGTGPDVGHLLRRWLFQPRVLLLMAAIVLATVLVPIVGKRLPDLRGRDEYVLSTADIVITPTPRWVRSDLVRQVIERAGLPETMSVLDDRLTVEIAEAFRLHPWVKEVVRVRKSLPARVEVELVYRQPVAMVQVKPGLYPVDAEAVLLPPADFSVPEAKRFPRIENVRTTPQGPAGTSWGDVGVLGAARLAELLAPHWETFGLAAIRVPRRTSANTTLDELTFELFTEGGSRIVWGRAPGTDHPGEPTSAQKIGRLKQYLSDFGTFDQPHGPYEIDIRHWQEISRRPLSLHHPRDPH